MKLKLFKSSFVSIFLQNRNELSGQSNTSTFKIMSDNFNIFIWYYKIDKYNR